LDPVAMLTKEPEMLQSDAFGEHTMQQNATVAGVSPWAPLGELSDPIAGFKGPLSGGQRDGKGEEGRRNGRKKGNLILMRSWNRAMHRLAKAALPKSTMVEPCFGFGLGTVQPWLTMVKQYG